MDPVPITGMTSNEALTNQLSALGLTRSDEVWVLALGYLMNISPIFANMLEVLSKDMLDPARPVKSSKFEARIEISPDTIGHDADWPHRMMAKTEPIDDVSAKVMLSMVASRSSVVYWEAVLPISCESLDVTPDEYGTMGLNEFCRYFLNIARNGHVEHWSLPPVQSWSEVLRNNPQDAFQDWLNSTHDSPRNLEIFQERFGLKSGKSKTLDDVGRTFDLTRERVRQINHRILERLCNLKRRKRLDFLVCQLNTLFEQYGGVMTLREIRNGAGFLGEIKGFSPLAIAELILYCSPLFSPVGTEASECR